MLIAVISAVSVVGAFARYRYWRSQGHRLQCSGFLPPPPSLLGRTVLRTVSRVGTFFVVGPVRVRYRAQAAVRPPTMIIANHQFELDFVVIVTALRLAVRHLGKNEEMRGWRGTAAAFCGFFAAAVDRGRSSDDRGAAVVDAGARAIVQGGDAPLLWFPQGHLVYDNVLRAEDFRTGAVRALRRAAELAEPGEAAISVLPVHVEYHRDPQDASWGWRLAQRIGFRAFRRHVQSREVGGESRLVTLVNHGATVSVGRAIRQVDLPADARQATEMLRQELLALAAAVQ